MSLAVKALLIAETSYIAVEICVLYGTFWPLFAEIQEYMSQSRLYLPYGVIGCSIYMMLSTCAELESCVVGSSLCANMFWKS